MRSPPVGYLKIDWFQQYTFDYIGRFEPVKITKPTAQTDKQNKVQLLLCQNYRFKKYTFNGNNGST